MRLNNVSFSLSPTALLSPASFRPLLGASISCFQHESLTGYVYINGIKVVQLQASLEKQCDRAPCCTLTFFAGAFTWRVAAADKRATTGGRAQPPDALRPPGPHPGLPDSATAATVVHPTTTFGHVLRHRLAASGRFGLRRQLV
jgi:hypothetical protein